MTEVSKRYSAHVESCNDCRYAPRLLCATAVALRQVARDALQVRRSRERKRA